MTSGDSLKLGGVWTWNDFRYDGDRQYGDNRIAGIPQHVIRGTLTYQHPSGVRVAPSVDWVPQGAYADQANTTRVPSYALVGLQLGWDLPNGLSLFIDGRNLMDKRYVGDISAIQDVTKVNLATNPTGLNIYYPGMGRSVYAGLRATF
jgi:iron complex outermembrane receptor protein